MLSGTTFPATFLPSCRREISFPSPSLPLSMSDRGSLVCFVLCRREQAGQERDSERVSGISRRSARRRRRALLPLGWNADPRFILRQDPPSGSAIFVEMYGNRMRAVRRRDTGAEARIRRQICLRI